MFQVAICDDDNNICNLLESYICKFSAEAFIKFDIQIFYSAEGLYRWIKSGEKPDLIFLDIELDGMDGIQLGVLIREELQIHGLQIVYISSYNQS